LSSRSSTETFILDLAKQARVRKVKDLMELAKRSGVFESEEEILSLVKALIHDEKLSLIELSGVSFESFIADFKKTLWFWATLSVAYLDTLVVSGLNNITIPVLQAGLGLVTIGFLPGFSLMKALFAERKLFNIWGWLALSVGLSVIVSPLIAFFSDYIIGRITTISLVLSLTSVITLFSMIGLVRSYQRARV
jgi:hypothetical protein